jgi:hypothetical protein|tara:strand:- start:3213 stop:4169 length:957 start_codon:yes stop_codon:yes gene_type:complete
MSTYKSLQGNLVQYLSSDPSPVVEGQVWYNSTSNTLKAYAVGAESWATGGNLNTARDLLFGSGTTLANTIVFGGDNGPSRVTSSEKYDGSSWTNTPSLNTARSAGGSVSDGTSSATLGFGGYPSTNTNEEWDGSSWTSTSTYGNSGYGMMGAGTQTAGLGCGGTGGTTTTFEYDGSSWTSGGAYPGGLYLGAVTGTQTAALGHAASGGAGNTTVKAYDGSTWSSSPAYPGGAPRTGAFGGTSGAVFGQNGPPDVSVTVNVYDGTSFSGGPNMSVAKGGLTGRGGTAASGLFCGTTSPRSGATEEWTGAVLGTQTISSS